MHKALLAEGLTSGRGRSVRPAATEAGGDACTDGARGPRVATCSAMGSRCSRAWSSGSGATAGDAETGAGADDGYTPMPNRPEERPGFGGWPDRPTH